MAEPDLELTILMPCLNEAETLAACVRQARQFLADNHVDGEVVVADNGSTDGSRDIAVAEGARMVPVPQRGYGSALLGGIEAARGRYVIMGDADTVLRLLVADALCREAARGLRRRDGQSLQGRHRAGSDDGVA